jgi:hypothetical protein
MTIAIIALFLILVKYGANSIENCSYFYSEITLKFNRKIFKTYFKKKH